MRDGALTLCLDAMYGNQPYGVLENVVVAEAQRSHGIGSQLMAYVEELCHRHDCSKIMLLSTASRAQAHRFFERHGFSAANKRGFVKYRSQFRPPQAHPDQASACEHSGVPSAETTPGPDSPVRGDGR